MIKKWILLIVFSMVLTACGMIDVQGQILDPNESVETQIVAAPTSTAAPTAAPTDTPEAIQLSFEATTYRDDEAGFTFEHPVGWGIGFQETQSRGHIVQLQDADGPRLDVVVYLWDPKGDLPSYLEVRRAALESSGTIQEEKSITLENGQEAVTYLVEGPDGSQGLFFITTLHDRYLQLSGGGDVELLAEIVQTVRLFEPVKDAIQGEPIECFTVTDQSELWVPCNVMDGIRSRNLSALLGSMVDPFTIGYWRSEGRSDSPARIIEELRSSRLPADPSTPMLFTANREAFPTLDGMPVDVMFGPELDIALVVYSKGWGTEGEGAALLYFVENAEGDLRWYGMVISETHFE